MDYVKGYDETNPISIEKYAQKLIGKTFADVCNEDDMSRAMVVRETIDYEVKHENRNRKGGLGEIIEERFFHYQCNNDAQPDFDKAGVELKVTPYKINKNGTLAAKERLIITMIDYFAVVDELFEESHVWSKARLILLIYYLYQQEIKSRLDYKIGYAKLFSPPPLKISEQSTITATTATTAIAPSLISLAGILPALFSLGCFGFVCVCTCMFLCFCCFLSDFVSTIGLGFLALFCF